MGIALTGLAVLLAIVLSAIVAVREFRRGSYLLSGFAALCLITSLAAALVPMPTHAVKVNLPAND